MAYTTINKHTDYFNTKLYTGNGSTQSITGVGFQPDFIWQKERDGTSYHVQTDSARGNTKQLFSNVNATEATDSNYITSFDSDGFGLGQNNDTNENSKNYLSWNWRAGGGAGSSNTDGSINTTTTSVNTTSGFSISTYTGNSTAGATIGHGLGVIPKMIIAKKRNGSPNWAVYHASQSASKYLELNTTAASQTDNAVWDGATPTASVFYVGSDNKVNTSGDTYVAYCFAEKTGYSKFGKYTGNNNANGTFVYTGFKPSFIIIKRDSSGYDWLMYTDKVNGINPMNDYLAPNESAVEVVDNSNQVLDILSNGFKHRGTGASTNGSADYFYMAFGQSLVGSNNVPCTAR